MLEFVENLSDYDGLGTEGLIPNNFCRNSLRTDMITYNVRESLNHDIFGATHTLSLSNLILKSQCVGGAKDVMV